MIPLQNHIQSGAGRARALAAPAACVGSKFSGPVPSGSVVFSLWSSFFIPISFPFHSDFIPVWFCFVQFYWDSRGLIDMMTPPVDDVSSCHKNWQTRQQCFAMIKTGNSSITIGQAKTTRCKVGVKHLFWVTLISSSMVLQ